jgi:hypothetical protein
VFLNLVAFLLDPSSLRLQGSKVDTGSTGDAPDVWFTFNVADSSEIRSDVPEDLVAELTNCSFSADTPVPGPDNHSLEFKGPQSYLELPSSQEVSFPDAFTIDAYFKLLDEQTDYLIAAKDAGLVTNYFLGILQGRPVFSVSDGSAVSVEGNSTVSPFVWHHIAAVRDRIRGMLLLYLDGVVVGQASDPLEGAVTNSALFYSGSIPGVMPGGKMRLDDLRLSGEALTPDQVRHRTERIVSAPWLVLPVESVSFDSLAIGATRPLDIEVINNGLVPLQFRAATEPPFWVSDAIAVAAPGNAATLSVSYRPIVRGHHEAWLVITSNDPRGDRRVRLSGSAVTAPALDLLGIQAVTLAQPVAIGGTDSVSVAVTNPGSGLLEVGFHIATPARFHVSPDSLSIGAGDTASVEVVFQPTQEGWSHSSLTITSNALSQEMVVLPLAAEGQPMPFLEVTDSDWPAYDKAVGVGDSVVDTLRIRNRGVVPLEINTILSGVSGFSAAGDGLVAGADSILAIPVEFHPLVEGSFSGDLRVFSNDPIHPLVRIPIAAEAAQLPVLSVVPNKIEFGAVRVDSSATVELVLSNPGRVDVIVDVLFLDSGPPYLMPAVGDLPFTIPTGLDRGILVVFRPFQAGSYDSRIIIRSNDARRSEILVGLQGTGVEAGRPPLAENLQVAPVEGGFLNDLNPEISWDFEDTQGDRQTAWHIQIGGDPGVADSDMWDSGKRQGSRKLVRYEGSDLAWNHTYGLRLRLWDAAGDSSDWRSLIFRTLANRSPIVSITSPAPGAQATWDSSRTVAFSGNARDDDEGGVSIDSLAWVSDLDGLLHGAASAQDLNFNVPVSGLSIGEHEITLRVWDDEGDSATARTGLSVRGLAPTARITGVLRNGDERFDSDRRKVDGLLTVHQFAFSGEGEDRDEGGSGLVEYRWSIRSLPDGEERPLSDEPSFDVDGTDLGPGLQMVYLRVVDDEGEQSEPDSMKVILRRGWGRAIIVGGGGYRGENYETFVMGTWGVAQYVYNRLYMNRQFAHESIDYLAPAMVLADTTVQVDDVPSTNALMQAIDRAQRDNVELGIPLLIFLAGHGREGSFLIGDDEELLAEDLADRLEGLVDAKVVARALGSPEAVPRDEIVLVVDICYSSTFLEKIAGPGRVVVGSSSRTVASVLSGRSFGSFFFEEISKGRDLWRSFNEASDRLQTDFDQTPYLDADGNGIPVYADDGRMNAGRDEEIASNVFIGGDYETSSRINPEIYGRPTALPAAGGSGVYTLEAVADKGLTVGCLVIPEDSDLTSEGVAANVVNLALVPSSTMGDTTAYQATHELLESGRYILVFQANDQLGNLAAQRAISVHYSALVGDFDGDGVVGFQDFIAFARVYGTQAGESGWDARYDMNSDDEVGFDDFVRFAQVYGSSG